MGGTKLLGGCQRGHLKPLVSTFELFLAMRLAGERASEGQLGGGGRVEQGSDRKMGWEGPRSARATGMAAGQWSCVVTVLWPVWVDGMDGIEPLTLQASKTAASAGGGGSTRERMTGLAWGSRQWMDGRENEKRLLLHSGVVDESWMCVCVCVTAGRQFAL